MDRCPVASLRAGLLQLHWFVPLTTNLAERLLYPSTLGISMIASIGISASLRRPVGRTPAVASLGAASLVASLSARRARVDEDSLWLYAVRLEPRATLHHHNASNTFFRANDLDLGAYHRFIDVYLVDRFPEPVPWEEIESMSSLWAAERFVALSAILKPEDPCRLVRLFTKKPRECAPLSEYVAEHWGPPIPSLHPVSTSSLSNFSLWSEVGRSFRAAGRVPAPRGTAAPSFLCTCPRPGRPCRFRGPRESRPSA